MLSVTKLREMQIRTTMSSPFTLVRVATMKKTRDDTVGDNMKKRGPLCTAGGMRNGTTAMENGEIIPQKIKNRSTV